MKPLKIQLARLISKILKNSTGEIINQKKIAEIKSSRFHKNDFTHKGIRFEASSNEDKADQDKI